MHDEWQYHAQKVTSSIFCALHTIGVWRWYSWVGFCLCVCCMWTITKKITHPPGGLPPGISVSPRGYHVSKKKTDPPRHFNFPPGDVISTKNSYPPPGGKHRTLRYVAVPSDLSPYSKTGYRTARSFRLLRAQRPPRTRALAPGWSNLMLRLPPGLSGLN